MLNDHGHLTISAPCLGCGYQLRGLASTGTCPECGADIARSTDSKLLRFADSRWAKRLALGASLVFWGALFSNLQIGYGFSTPLYERLYYVIVGTLPGLVALAGWWLLTRPSPQGDALPFARAVFALACVAFALHCWTSLWKSQHHDDPVALFTNAASVLISLGWLALLPPFAWHLAGRVGQPVLARRGWLLPLVIACVYLMLWTVALVQWALRGTATMPLEAKRGGTMFAQFGGIEIQAPLTYLAIPLLFVFLIAMIVALVTAWQFTTHLRHEARIAADNHPGRSLENPPSDSRA